MAEFIVTNIREYTRFIYQIRKHKKNSINTKGTIDRTYI